MIDFCLDLRLASRFEFHGVYTSLQIKLQSGIPSTAFALGTPIICSKIESLQFYTEENYNSIYFDGSTEHIVSLILDPSKNNLHKMRNNIRNSPYKKRLFLNGVILVIL